MYEDADQITWNQLLNIHDMPTIGATILIAIIVQVCFKWQANECHELNKKAFHATANERHFIFGC